MTEQLKNLVEGRHPEYEENLAHWNFLESTYEGGREWFLEHIFKFVKEGDVEFAERIKRAYRFNHTKQVVDQVDKYLFKMGISRKVDDAPDALKEFWKKSTLSGLDIDIYAKRQSNSSSKFGRVWVVVDSNYDGDTITSVADAKKSSKQIYSYIVRPQDMLDMSYDEMGVLNWCLVREFYRDDADPLNSGRKEHERFRLWTRNEWVLIECEVRRGKKRYYIADTGEHNLGEVPVTPCDHVFSEEMYEAAGLIDDIAYQDRAVANYLSNLDAIIQDQTFSQLAMPAQGLLPGEDGYDKLITMSTKRVFTYNGEGGQKPFYLSPDPKQAELILGAIGKIINEIYHSVGLTGERTQEDNGGGVDNASGVAKSYDFERVNSLLAAKAQSLQKTERAVARLVCLYAGIKDVSVDELIVYPTDFDVRSVYDEFEIAAQLSVLSAPDEVRREQMRTLITKLFPAASEKVAALLEKSLKAWPPELPTVESGLGAGKPNSGGSPLKAANTQKVAKELVPTKP